MLSADFDLVRNAMRDSFLCLKSPESTDSLKIFVDRFIATFGIESAPKNFAGKVHD